MKDEPPMDAKCKDKFLVLSVVVTADQDFSNIASIVSTSLPTLSSPFFSYGLDIHNQQWQEVERMNKSSIQERKIRVNYLPAEAGPDSTGDQSNGVVCS
jgi:hypothetical protein